jgi:uncharacterized protein YlxW (UPF0749 family)
MVNTEQSSAPNGTDVTRPPRPVAWRVLVPLAALCAGLLFAVQARSPHTTTLHTPGTSANLAALVRGAEAQVAAADRTVRQLAAQQSDAAKQAGADDAVVAGAQAKVGPLQQPAGLTAVTGPGIAVTLNDAANPAALPGVDPNILVVHQSDIQAVVNSLWAGGAQAMTIAGQRVIATSAVRCVGNTLLLNGNVYSPPFRVEAIGPYSSMKQALAASPGVRQFVQAAHYYGLGYSVENHASLELPAYAGSISLNYAKVAGK